MKDNPQDLVTKAYLDIRLDEIKEEINGEIKEFRSDILSGLDKVMAEFENAREDRIISNHKLDEVYKMVTKHENRITSLEEQQKN